MGGASHFDGYISHGPWGGSQGKEWVYMPEQGFIKKISVWHGECVDSIKFETRSIGHTQPPFPCGKAGNRIDTICFNYPSEYLVSISGTIGWDHGYDVVKSICFKTNEKSYGPFGTYSDCDTAFRYDGKGGVIVGFHGRVTRYLTAIGVYVTPKSLAFSRISASEHKIMHELCSIMPEMVMPRGPGPWGVGGGRMWDDGVFSAIKQVHVHLGELSVIYALQFEYLKKDGKSVWSQIHGGTDGSKVEPVNLEGKDEYLIGISGYYGRVEEDKGSEAIASITFHTNKRIHGPYGKEKGAGHVYYSSTSSPGKVVGFHGQNGVFLSAIGVHMEYF